MIRLFGSLFGNTFLCLVLLIGFVLALFIDNDLKRQMNNSQ
jgi:hypothetical protein